ncbi:hypothetical protein CDAR_45201 [Caerostris darwini]|uniref:Uncharacterized protein n=1 Tax=Caerostris darwini TaxID=1538125 RepID=A0AAV4QDW3_9ARAC|nr:hypothetical protein CDAR_45201 [Caerostris darwini]
MFVKDSVSHNEEKKPSFLGWSGGGGVEKDLQKEGGRGGARNCDSMKFAFLRRNSFCRKIAFLLFESCNGTRSEGEGGENINGGSDGRAEWFLVEPEWTHSSTTVPVKGRLSSISTDGKSG